MVLMLQTCVWFQTWLSPLSSKYPTLRNTRVSISLETTCRCSIGRWFSYTNDENLIIYFFKDSLSGASLDLYMQLERNHIQKWKDIVDAFLKQYKYNIDMDPNRKKLQNLSQKNDESFKEYSQRWRDLASRMQPLILERQQVDIFMGTLQGKYY